MRSKYLLVGLVGMLAGVLLSSVVVVLAGSTDSTGPPDAPAGQMYTLEQIYDRVTTGAAPTKMDQFTEPDSGPTTGTGRTLDEVWAVTRAAAWLLINKTGQTTSYADGDDGYYQMGIDPALEPTGDRDGAYNTPPAWGGVRFTDNGDGTVTDNLMGLIWLKNANCAGTCVSWDNALTWANGLHDGCTDCGGTEGDCGLSDGSSAWDWRLPNVNELHSLIDLSQSRPGLPAGHPFDGVQLDYYWSSTTVADYADYAWDVDLYGGQVNFNGKDYIRYVWPVRGGQ